MARLEAIGEVAGVKGYLSADLSPGFGYSGAGGSGSRAVLEVRSHEVPFVLEHGQTVGRLMFERLIEPPQRLYGQGIGSNYQRQGLALSKHFKRI